ncbi:MAG: hypothetical protein GX811_09845, partial [Lentisphaerae bacterium]|nr:hypothetical protein [Lentisphaerota bacterium]
MIRAQGGVGINTENPQAGLHVNSNQTDGILVETTATSGIAVKGLGNSGIGIYGEGGDKGLAGYSSSGTAVYANSDTGFGLKAYNNNSASSTSVAAIYGKSISEDAGQFISTGGVAVRATSNSGDTVIATSDSSDAERAISTSGIAVRAKSTSG